MRITTMHGLPLVSCIVGARDVIKLAGENCMLKYTHMSWYLICEGFWYEHRILVQISLKFLLHYSQSLFVVLLCWYDEYY